VTIVKTSGINSTRNSGAPKNATLYQVAKITPIIMLLKFILPLGQVNMPVKKIILLSIVLMALLKAFTVQAMDLKTFTTGSYKTIEATYANQPFILVVWSISCSSCLKDMALLHKVHSEKPTLKMVMLATDGPAANSQIEAILQKSQLTDIEQWNYSEANSSKLNYEIDPNWYGELPRTYFLDKNHQRQGISGMLTAADYQARLAGMLP
jgi:thiol-disulfide isomerase/thioredoxin